MSTPNTTDLLNAHLLRQSPLSSQSRIRDLIISNFIKKHMPQLYRDPMDDTMIANQIRISKILEKHVDSYLNNGKSPAKSV